MAVAVLEVVGVEDAVSAEVPEADEVVLDVDVAVPDEKSPTPTPVYNRIRDT